MKVLRVVRLTQEHAVLQLRPSWLARLFGAKDIVCELERCDGHWVSKYTRERLGWCKHSTLLKDAMEGYPLEESGAYDEDDDTALPKAVLLKE